MRMKHSFSFGWCAVCARFTGFIWDVRYFETGNRCGFVRRCIRAYRSPHHVYAMQRGGTPLILAAAYHGNVDIVKYLLSVGANVEHENKVPLPALLLVG